MGATFATKEQILKHQLRREQCMPKLARSIPIHLDLVSPLPLYSDVPALLRKRARLSKTLLGALWARESRARVHASAASHREVIEHIAQRRARLFMRESTQLWQPRAKPVNAPVYRELEETPAFVRQYQQRAEKEVA